MFEWGQRFFFSMFFLGSKGRSPVACWGWLHDVTGIYPFQLRRLELGLHWGTKGVLRPHPEKQRAFGEEVHIMWKYLVFCALGLIKFKSEFIVVRLALCLKYFVLLVFVDWYPYIVGFYI